MRDKIFSIFRYLYLLKDKIAFFPSIIAFIGCCFAYLMMFLESKGISKKLIEIAPELVINNTETARVILTTFIAGLISIMVFSFSMVMILLNQASSNFSPRLLPGLISNRRHQIILGIYLATILYCIFILVYIEPEGNKYQLPGFSVLLSIVLMVISLASFIYFIHSISQEIQINNIMKDIFQDAKNRLLYLINDEKDKNLDFPNSDSWAVYNSKTAGYFHDISLKIIAEIANKNECRIEIMCAKGTFINDNIPLFKTEKKLDDKIIKRIHENFDFTKNDFIQENYVLAFKQITEIAVKSMSPAINDPGTAMNAIDYLNQLFCIRIHKKDKNLTFIDKKAWVLIKSISFNELLYQVLVALRTYCKHDVLIIKKLLLMLKHLKEISSDNYKKSIENEIELLLFDAELTIENKEDLKYLRRFI